MTYTEADFMAAALDAEARAMAETARRHGVTVDEVRAQVAAERKEEQARETARLTDGLSDDAHIALGLIDEIRWAHDNEGVSRPRPDAAGDPTTDTLERLVEGFGERYGKLSSDEADVLEDLRTEGEVILAFGLWVMSVYPDQSEMWWGEPRCCPPYDPDRPTSRRRCQKGSRTAPG